MRDEYKCQRCHGEEFVIESRMLAGSYYVRLCQGCLNNWHDYYLSLPEATQFGLSGARLGSAIRVRDEAAMAAICDEQRALSLRLHAAARDWVTAGVPEAVTQE